MKKKLIALMLSALMCASLFTACSGQSKAPITDEEETEQEQKQKRQRLIRKIPKRTPIRAAKNRYREREKNTRKALPRKTNTMRSLPALTWTIWPRS